MTVKESETKLESSPCESFLERAQFPHTVAQRSLIETHISCVILTGEFAYKIKKNVDLGFVDYTSMEKRKHFCELEVQLNRRFAPEIYLGVVPVYSLENTLKFGELGELDSPETGSSTIDYAVKMKQFPQDAIIAQRMEHPELTGQAVEDFGRSLAKMHGHSESAIPTLPFVAPEQILADAIENFETLLVSLAEDPRFEPLSRLEKWTRSKESKLVNRFADRLARGLVKRCHGDLHLKNVIQVDGKLIAFDGIEFNEKFRCIDVLSELAFPVMDFFARGRSGLGWRLMNAYLEANADYSDLDVLQFYLVYRAMVRAKVAWLNPDNHTLARRAEYLTTDNPTDPFAGPWDKYLKVAQYFAFGLIPSLSITHGFSGSGKSTIAMQMIEQQGGIRIRSDALRHELADQFKVSNKYSAAMNDWVYATLAQRSAAGIRAGFPVIADATFLKEARRQPFLEIARRMKCPFTILDCDVPYEELCRRLRARTNDPSEADIAALDLQLNNHDPLTDVEKQFVRSFDDVLSSSL